MQYITPSLHSSVYWFLRIDNKSTQELMETLAKVPTPPNEAMQAGIKFEDDVFAYCEGGDLIEDDSYSSCVKEVGDIVRGGIWQESLFAPVSIGLDDYMLFGKSDVIKENWIYDIKFSKSYDVGKYNDSIQHLVYMYASGIENFAYLVSNGRDVWREDYHWNNQSEQTLKVQIANLVEFLKSEPDFWNLFVNHWNWKNRKIRKDEHGLSTVK